MPLTPLLAVSPSKAMGNSDSTVGVPRLESTPGLRRLSVGRRGKSNSGLQANDEGQERARGQRRGLAAAPLESAQWA